jgi:hypothetical protein
LLTEILKGASSLATLATRRLWDLDVTMRDADARAVAGPVARLIARRWEIRSDLNDATDVAEGGGGLAAWIKRVATSDLAAPEPSGAPGEHERPAAPPASPQEPPRATAAPPPPPPPPPSAPTAGVHDRDGRAVPGTGPAKETFLTGFEDV